MAATTFLKIENLVESTLDGAILAGDGTLDVQAGTAANFGAVNFHIVVGDTSQGFEIMTVSNVAGDTMTVARAVENVGGAAGVALPFDDGTAVRMAITDKYMQAAYDAINDIEDGTKTLDSVTAAGDLIAANLRTAGDVYVGTGAAADGRVYFGSDEDVYISNTTADTRLDIAAGAGVYVSADLHVGDELTVTGDAINDSAGVWITSDGAANTSLAGTLDVVDNIGVVGTVDPHLLLYNTDATVTINQNLGLIRFYTDDTDIGVRVEVARIGIRAEASFAPNVSPTYMRFYSNPTGGALISIGEWASNGDLSTVGDIIVQGNNIEDSGGAAITFDGASNTQIDGTLTAVGLATFNGGMALQNGDTFLRGVSIISQAITWDGGAVQPCATVADGYVITDVYIEITTTFDGDAVVTVGDGIINDGYLTDAGINQGVAGYYGHDISTRGARLVGGDRRIYASADTVDAFVTQTTATQGAATVYVVIQRLK